MEEKIEVEKQLIQDCLIFTDNALILVDKIKIPFFNFKKTEDYQGLIQLREELNKVLKK